MARFLSLNSRTGLCLGVAGLGWIGCFSTPSRAQTPMTPAPAPSAPAKPAPAKPAPGKPAAPLPSQDTLNRYGGIVVPGNEATHPLRLQLPFPGVGEVKIPNQGELTMREKLEQLAALSDDEIHVQLQKWPAYSKMTLRDQAAMLTRIQDFRDYRSKIAMQKAHEMGLLTLTDEQKKKFEKDYWDKRLQMDRELAKQFEPVYKAEEQKFKDELYREFSSISSIPLAQNAKPPVPPVPSVNKPGPPAPAKPTAPSTAANTSPVPPPASGKNVPTVGASADPIAQH